MKRNLLRKTDALDLQIIKTLEENSRISLRSLSRRVGHNPNKVSNHLHTLEREGIIKKYAPILDSAKMGYSLTALIMIQVEGGHLIEAENEIAKENNVLSVYDVTGEFDIIVFAKFRNNDDLNVFLKHLLTMRFIKRTVTMTALNVIKESDKII